MMATRTLDPVTPPPVHAGAVIGVAALSGPVDPERLARGCSALESAGYRLELGANLETASGFLAGNDRERIDAFHELLRTESVDAIVFARGGHGLLRVIEDIDWDLVASKPRWFMGYSDITPLLWEIGRRTGWATIHGPMVATDFDRPLDALEWSSVRAALEGTYEEAFALQPVVEEWRAHGEGRLIGGCLAMVCAALGTSVSPERLFADSIVFLEDVGEPAYRIDRYLAQLSMVGLDGALAVVFGHCKQEASLCIRDETGAQRLTDRVDAEVLEVLADWSRKLRLPIAVGLPCGHGVPNHALPLGVAATITGRRLNVSLQSSS